MRPSTSYRELDAERYGNADEKGSVSSKSWSPSKMTTSEPDVYAYARQLERGSEC